MTTPKNPNDGFVPTLQPRTRPVEPPHTPSPGPHIVPGPTVGDPPYTKPSPYHKEQQGTE